MEEKNPLPDGLVYIENFLSQEYHDALVEFIDSQPWNTSLARRTQHMGQRYQYRGGHSDDYVAPEMPKIFDSIREALKECFGKLPDQAIVNEYEPGQGIAAHTDDVRQYGPVVASISLLAPVEMEFSYSGKVFKQILQPCSIVVLSGDARYKWKHEIKKRKSDKINSTTVKRSKRISITLRTVA
jgi:alkylated DNA repair dioxygenase AlkB